MDALTQFVTAYGAVVAIGGGLVLFLLSGQNRNRADIQWVAWDNVRDFALIVENCNLPHTALIEKIERVQERFDSRGEDSALSIALKGISK